MDNRVDYKQSYIEGSCGNAGSYRVNVRTGRLDFIKELVTLDGSLMPLKLSLVFNGSYNGKFFAKDFAIGWKLNVMQYVYPDDNDDVYYYIDKNYRTHLFKKLSDKLYYDTDHTGLLLHITEENITISDDAGSELIFEDGYLTKIREVRGTFPIETTIHYEDCDDNLKRLISVTDGMGRTATMDYTESAITCPNGEKIKFVVSSIFLDAITEITGETHRYTYDLANNAVFLKTITAGNGESVDFSYSSDKINSVSEKFNGNDVTDYEFIYDYSYHTLVKVYKNKSIWTEPIAIRAYQFAEDGSIISSSEVDDDGEIISPIYKSQDAYDNYVLNVNSPNIAIGKVDGEDEFQSPAAGKSIEGSFGTEGEIDIDDEFAIYATVLANYLAEYNTNKISLCVMTSSLRCLASIKFSSACIFPQTNAARFNLSHWKEALKEELVDNKLPLSKLKFCVRADEGADVATIKNVRISQIKNTGTVTCIRESITGPKIKMATSGDDEMWTKLTSCKLEGVSDCEKITATDWTHNKRALAGNKNIIWYNDLGAAVAGGGETNVIVNESEMRTIASFNPGMVTFNRKTTVFEYATFTATGATITQNKVRNGESRICTTRLDGYLRVITETNFENTKSEYAYDDYGRQISATITSSSGHKITNSLTHHAPESGIYGETETDSANNKWLNLHQFSTGDMIAAIDPRGNGVSYAYDNASRLTDVSSTANTSNKNTIAYAKGNVSSLKHSGADYEYAYGARGEISSIKLGGVNLYNTENIIFPNGYEYRGVNHGGFEQYLYDKFGRVVARQCGTETVQYIYGAMTDNVSDITDYSDSRLHVNTASKLRKSIDGELTKTYHYNSYGELNNIICSDGITCDLRTDEYGRAEMEKYDFGSKYYQSSYSYYNGDSLIPDRLRNVTVESTEAIAAFNYAYDSLGRLTQTVLSYLDFKVFASVDVMSQSYGYDANAPERIASLTFKNKSGQATETLNYGYDASGNITSVNETRYTYDALNRLTREDNPTFNTSCVYEYDDGGNITGKKEYPYTTGALGTAKKTYAYTYGNSKWKDQLTAWDGKTFAYDSVGRPTMYKGNALSWGRNRMTKFGDINFTYNGDGYLTGITSATLSTGLLSVSSETCRYENGKLLKFTRELTLNGWTAQSAEMYFLYNGNEVIGIVHNGTHYYYRKNLQGDILGIVGLDGTEVATYAYDAWGNCKIIKNSDIATDNPFRYRGYFYDVHTGLYYLITRFYDPETGRFLSPDDFAYLAPETLNGLNLYAYCLNNPVIGRIIGAISAISTSYNANSYIYTAKASSNTNFSNNSISLSNPSLSTPFANKVWMTNYSVSLVKSRLVGMFFGNISFTTTIQHNEAGAFYSFINTGSSNSVGVGFNWGWYGQSIYVSDNIGVGSSVQIGDFTFSGEVSILEGITVSFGINSGNVTNEVSVNIGWITMGGIAVATGIASVPVPGARVVAALVAFGSFLVDLFV